MIPAPSPVDPVEQYDKPRGKCPRCGSPEVTHLIIGLLEVFVDDVFPAWAVPVGCVHPGHDRECAACGAAWLSDQDFA